MAKDPYEKANRMLEELEKDYFPTLSIYREKGGDIDVFADFRNRLLELEDYIEDLPPDDRQFEIRNEIVAFTNAINCLIH
ncbi:hypothetical protein IKE98_03720 [Candidatus Saccharibacteria bacterium]|nr:hypothetical protein [Candidatus Saccharibacteria bacterium]